MLWPGYKVIFSGWGEYLSLGLPGALMLQCEWVVYETLVLMAGWIGVSQLSAMSLICNFTTCIFTIPYGLCITVSVLVGNSLGSNRPELAK
jgi:multidrug resistance protein, MATE family